MREAKKIKKICKQYGLDFNAKEYNEEVAAFEYFYGEGYNDGPKSSKESYVEYMMEVCVVRKLKPFKKTSPVIKGNGDLEKMPQWVQDQICFIYNKNQKKISVEHIKAYNFEDMIWEMYLNKIKIKGIIGDNVVSQCDLMKLFNEVDAKNFLLKKVKRKIEKITEGMKRKYRLEKLSAEIKEVIGCCYQEKREKEEGKRK